MNYDKAQLIMQIFESTQEAFALAITNNVVHFAGKCESPIEVLLVGTLATWDLVNPGSPDFFGFIHGDWGPNYSKAINWVEPQFKWDKYRIDIAIHTEGGLVFVECDGHQFHERTPAQAERDRARDREIQQAGIPILRFTGTEINRDPFDCVKKIVEFLAAKRRNV